MAYTKTEEERKIIFSKNVQKYTFGGWLRGAQGKLILYEEELEFKYGFGSFKPNIIFNLNDIEIKLTKVTGFMNLGLHITDSSGQSLKIYSADRKKLENYLEKYIV